MNHPLIEICVDNLESLMTANQFPIQRIELCSALSVGGITPNYGLLKRAVEMSTLPLAVMIRPRAGDFLYSEYEVQVMFNDIEMARNLGINHIVIGALTADAEIDMDTTRALMTVAQGMDVTFHRAFDLCRDPYIALEQLIELGCDYVLTSGQAPNALQGVTILKQLIAQAGNRIQIMAGCGITAENVTELMRQTGVSALHFSAKSERQSAMAATSAATMGSNAEQDRRMIVTDPIKVADILQRIKEVDV
ncbi:copper homeostasis protein CutC [Glaesserella sp.]|uniref:copper homeostasis protein CutC n=1 Tax=Glaesserella sp. TaxID=2094731 RepID=UPI00359F3A90